jgi:branched-chain amino acid transport system permease protein
VRRVTPVLLAALWVGLLTLPLQVRVEKMGEGLARFEPRLDRSATIALGVAAVGLAFLALGRLHALAPVASGVAGAGRLLGRARDRVAASPPLAWAAATLPVALALALPLGGNAYHVSVGTQTAIYVGLALGLNIVVGQAGLLVLGYAAFYGVGAYTYAVLNRDLGVGFWLGLAAGAAVAALFGLLLGAPTLRLSGDYLAIVTLGFGEMTRIVFVTSDRLTGGPNGILGIDRPRLGRWEASDVDLYLMAVAMVVVVAAISLRLNRSRLGRAWVAMREDETAARVMGIDITRMRLLAFSLSASWAGVCGVFFAAKQSFISPESFTFLESVTVLAMVVLGGMGSVGGVIAGAVILALLPEALRQFSDYRMITLAGLMIALMVFRPQGLFPSRRRRLELTEDEGR